MLADGMLKEEEGIKDDSRGEMERLLVEEI